MNSSLHDWLFDQSEKNSTEETYLFILQKLNRIDAGCLEGLEADG